jgi:uncharacterized protein YcfJ
MKKWLVLPVVALTLAAAACTPTERAVGGAAIGAGAGALIGGAAAGGRGAAIGALAGAAGGAIIGAATAEEQCPYGYYRYRGRYYCR